MSALFPALAAAPDAAVDKDSSQTEEGSGYTAFSFAWVGQTLSGISPADRVTKDGRIGARRITTDATGPPCATRSRSILPVILAFGA